MSPPTRSNCDSWLAVPSLSGCVIVPAADGFAKCWRWPACTVNRGRAWHPCGSVPQASLGARSSTGCMTCIWQNKKKLSRKWPWVAVETSKWWQTLSKCLQPRSPTTKTYKNSTQSHSFWMLKQATDMSLHPQTFHTCPTLAEFARLRDLALTWRKLFQGSNVYS